MSSFTAIRSGTPFNELRRPRGRWFSTGSRTANRLPIRRMPHSTSPHEFFAPRLRRAGFGRLSPENLPVRITHFHSSNEYAYGPEVPGYASHWGRLARAMVNNTAKAQNNPTEAPSPINSGRDGGTLRS